VAIQRRFIEARRGRQGHRNPRRLENGQLARFYELRSNKPLYFTKDYKLTYDDSDTPAHYAFKVSGGLDAISRDYEGLRNTPFSELANSGSREKRNAGSQLAPRVRTIIAALYDRGAWVEDGRLRYHGPDDPTTRVIRCSTFRTNVEVLSDFIRSFNAPERSRND